MNIFETLNPSDPITVIAAIIVATLASYKALIRYKSDLAKNKAQTAEARDKAAKAELDLLASMHSQTSTLASQWEMIFKLQRDANEKQYSQVKQLLDSCEADKINMQAQIDSHERVLVNNNLL